MPDIVVPAGWLTDASGEQWYWDGHGWRGNRTDFEAAMPTSERAAHNRASQRPQLSIPSGPHVLQIEIVGEDRHLPAIERLIDPFGDDADELIAVAQLRAVPGHRNDHLAVEVTIGGQVVGHVPSEVTPAIQPHVAANPETNVVARVWSGSRAGRPHARVTLFYEPA